MSTVKIGWSKREISTNEPVSMLGQMYMRISEGIHDPLYVTALCVDGGDVADDPCNGKVIFLSCDLVTQFEGVLEPLRARVKERFPEIPEKAIVWNATHTHSSIPVCPTGDKTPDGAYVYPGSKVKEMFIERAADAVCEAWSSRAEGGISYGYGFAVVAHSRRVVYFKEEKLAQNKHAYMTPPGYAVMYGNTADPLFSHYEAGADHYLNLMFTFDKNEKLTGMVINVPCPSQLSEHFTTLSADYWHDVREMVAKEYGEEVYVLPQCAAAGDLSPRTLHYKEAQARRMELKYGLKYDPAKAKVGTEDLYRKVMSERYDIAERITDGVREVLSWARKDIRTELPVYHHFEILPLERRKITEEEEAWCTKNLKELESMAPTQEGKTAEEYRVAYSNHMSAVRRNKAGLSRSEAVKKEPYLDMPIHVVRIGDIAFATVRYELYMDFMHRLQARSPFIQTFVIQLAGCDGAGYLATERAVEAKGYSASMFCNIISAKGGQQWVEGALSVLNELKNKE